MIRFSRDTLSADCETHSVEERWSKAPGAFFRLGQYSWGESPVVHTTTDLAEFRRVLKQARVIIGANFIQFDLPAVFGNDSIAPVALARQGRIFDTTVAATLANPAPFGSYANRSGQTVACASPAQYRKWYSLDNQAFVLGTEGKSADLRTLVDRYTHTWVPTYSEKTGRRLKHDTKVPNAGVCCGFGAIPLDDPEFLEYARQDVIAVREVARRLLEKHPFDRYMRREMLKTALAGQISRTGWRVDTAAAQARAAAQHDEAARVLGGLAANYGLPTSGKKPLASAAGKAALAAALSNAGVPGSALARTAQGAPSYGGESVVAACAGRGDAAEALGAAVAALAGQRSLPELLLAETAPDGRVHPDIFPLQRSGRWSTTRPGLTVWSPDHKDLLLPNGDDELLVEFDFSQADARAVAAMSGDPGFAARFVEGADGHMINALAAWGAATVATDPKGYRQRAKAPGHGWGYKMGARKMASATGLSEAECKRFIGALNTLYPGVVAWQKRVTTRAQRFGVIVNAWGRRMPVEPGREFTQTPALLGQGATHELLCDGLARLDDRRLRQVVITVHDALVASIPRERLEEDLAYYLDKFAADWHPAGGQKIRFTLGCGAPGRNWKEAQHG